MKKCATCGKEFSGSGIRYGLRDGSILYFCNEICFRAKKIRHRNYTHGLK